MHFMRFEGSMMWKQAGKSELKNEDISQTVQLQNRFWGPTRKPNGLFGHHTQALY